MGPSPLELQCSHSADERPKCAVGTTGPREPVEKKSSAPYRDGRHIATLTARRNC